MANKNPMQPEPISRELNSALVEAALKIVEWPSINLHDAEAVKLRTREYFELCDRQGMRPSNLGLYAAWGMSKQDVSNALSGFTRNKVSPEALDFIQKAKLAISSYREQLALQGKLSPPIAIFWAKNYDGMADVTTLEVSRADEQALKPQMTPAEIAAQIEQDIPIDEEYVAELSDID